jgi:hypothetical protein
VKHPLLLLALATVSGAQTLPGNFETSLLCDSASAWVSNAQDQISRLRVRGAGDSTSIATWTPGLSVSNAYADYPVWNGLARKGRVLIPLASLDGSRHGYLSGFWRSWGDSSRIIDSQATAGLPMPTAWALAGDTAWGASDSSQVLWHLDRDDSLSAWGLTALGLQGRLDSLERCGSCSLSGKLTAKQTLRGIGRDSSGTLWIASQKGLWRGSPSSLIRKDSLHAILGVWPGRRAALVQTDSALRWSASDTSGLQPLRGDTSALSGCRIGSVAWLGDTAWILLQKSGIGLPGIARVWNDSILTQQTGKTPSLYDAEDGLPFTESVNLAAIAREGSTGRLWVASRGEGLAVRESSAWRLVRHQTALRNNLLEVRVFPTRLESGSSLIAYNLESAGNVDIEVFNGAMEKVRTIASGAPRHAGQGSVRSESISQDRWDGCTDGKRLASIGLYYVRVKSGSQVAWGKVFQLKGGASCD